MISDSRKLVVAKLQHVPVLPWLIMGRCFISFIMVKVSFSWAFVFTRIKKSSRFRMIIRVMMGD
jgi:hypothetical protein